MLSFEVKTTYFKYHQTKIHPGVLGQWLLFCFKATLYTVKTTPAYRPPAIHFPPHSLQISLLAFYYNSGPQF